MKKKNILLSISCNEYFEALLVMIKSFIKKNKVWFDGEIHILDIGISSKNLQRLPSNIITHKIELPLTYGDDWHSKSFAKFEIYKFSEDQKVLYLDADLVVLRDLREFFGLPEGVHAFSEVFNNRSCFDTCVIFFNSIDHRIYDQIKINFANEIKNYETKQKYDVEDSACTFNVQFTPLNKLYNCKKKIYDVIDKEGNVISKNDYFLDTPFYKWWDCGKKYQFFYQHKQNMSFKSIHHLLDSKKQSNDLKSYLVKEGYISQKSTSI